MDTFVCDWVCLGDLLLKHSRPLISTIALETLDTYAGLMPSMTQRRRQWNPLSFRISATLSHDELNPYKARLIMIAWQVWIFRSFVKAACLQTCRSLGRIRIVRCEVIVERRLNATSQVRSFHMMSQTLLLTLAQFVVFKFTLSLEVVWLSARLIQTHVALDGF